MMSVKSVKSLVFITSLERSGSTLLDITLGRHPQLVSFGEVARVLLPHGGEGMRSVVDRPCSCGKVVRECPFWGVVTEQIRLQEKSLSLSDRYAIFLSRFDEIYGGEFIPVDSSKFLRAMEALKELESDKFELCILFTVRDVRGWGVSSRKAARRKREIPYRMIFSSRIKKFWKSYIRYNVLRHVPFWLPLEWLIRNQTIERFLSRGKFSAIHLSYERFSLNTDEVLNKIYKFTGIKSLPLSDKSSTHIVRGNRMAFDAERNANISYDAEWLSELWPQYEPMIWPFVMIKNKKWVYES